MKKSVYVIIGLLILISGILITAVAVDKTNKWHSGDQIKILIDTSEITLQNAIDQNLFLGSHIYNLFDSVPDPGHNASEIWVSVKDGEMSLLDGLSSANKLCPATPIETEYTGPSDKSNAYHYATEIEINATSSLQDAINSGQFCYNYLWKNSSWGTCSVPCSGGTQTRTVWCERNDGTHVSDSYCIPPKPVASQTCNTQICSGTGCPSCPWGNSGSGSGHCNLNGRQGRWKSPYSGSWSSWSYTSSAAMCYIKITCSGNCQWEIKT